MHNAGAENENRRDDFIFGLIRQRLDNEWDRWNGLDNKAGNLIGFTSVVIGLLLGAITIKLTILIQNPILSTVYFAGVAILLLSICFSLMVIKIRSWVAIPNVKHLLKHYTRSPYNEVLRRVAGTMSSAIELAKQHNDSKAKHIERSWYSLLAGLALIFIFMIMYFLSEAGIIIG